MNLEKTRSILLQTNTSWTPGQTGKISKYGTKDPA